MDYTCKFEQKLSKIKLSLLRKCFESQNPYFHFGWVLRPFFWSSSQCVRCSCIRFVFFSFRSIVSAFRLAWSFVFRWLTGRFSVLRKDIGISSNDLYQCSKYIWLRILVKWLSSCFHTLFWALSSVLPCIHSLLSKMFENDSFPHW